MNHVNFNPEKFNKDEYGNLIPKGKPDTCRAPQHVIDSVKPDIEIIIDEYGLAEEPEIHRPHRSN